MSLTLSPKSLMMIIFPLFMKHYCIFKMIRIFASNIVLTFLPQEVLEYFGSWPQLASDNNALIIFKTSFHL